MHPQMIQNKHLTINIINIHLEYWNNIINLKQKEKKNMKKIIQDNYMKK
jgi:hypothetical protein